ncbi:hypothetical protein LZ575_10875 [Antarcticibacterium sp. 1MA-6-2]|uniref:hypothetical protein n=1 Tax=Antarcticibacterium sp. 1MA-6-2 TaxID=2908210 RepID=UPI001F43FF54|nr:hypothetical protein [Antarcticibacterium sp. 1MA-6-2]UJH92866.1 hypothetical protein LZ575_10875 [Antarcticibacterium sp. 1MA-6-2]
MKKIKYSASFLLVFLMFGCTDLEETTYSELSKSNFYNNKLEIIQATLRPFTHMQAWLAWSGQNGYYYHNELSADQVAWPQKGRHGYDGGDHIRQHYHTWTPEEGRLRGAWSLMWGGVGYVNAAIEDISQVDPAAARYYRRRTSVNPGRVKSSKSLSLHEDNGHVGKCSYCDSGGCSSKS